MSRRTSTHYAPGTPQRSLADTEPAGANDSQSQPEVVSSAIDTTTQTVHDPLPHTFAA